MAPRTTGRGHSGPRGAQVALLAAAVALHAADVAVGPLPENCTMVADDTAMDGGAVVPAADTVGACCRACAGDCRQWSFTAGNCTVDPIGRAAHRPGSSFGTVPESRCEYALARLCSAARASSVGDCFVCAGRHQRELEAAACGQGDVGAFC